MVSSRPLSGRDPRDALFLVWLHFTSTFIIQLEFLRKLSEPATLLVSSIRQKRRCFIVCRSVTFWFNFTTRIGNFSRTSTRICQKRILFSPICQSISFLWSSEWQRNYDSESPHKLLPALVFDLLTPSFSCQSIKFYYTWWHWSPSTSALQANKDKEKVIKEIGKSRLLGKMSRLK